MKGIVYPDCFYVFSPRFSVNSTPVGGLSLSRSSGVSPNDKMHFIFAILDRGKASSFLSYEKCSYGNAL